MSTEFCLQNEKNVFSTMYFPESKLNSGIINCKFTKNNLVLVHGASCYRHCGFSTTTQTQEVEIKKVSEEQFNAKISPQISKPVPKLILEE